MELYIVRHAWAGEHGDPRWPNDQLRPLTESGRRRFAKMVARLQRRGMKVDAVATSPMARCRETAEILAHLQGGVDVCETEDLLPGSSLEGMLGWTSRQGEHCAAVAWVGHAPDVSRLVAGLIGGANGWMRFAKGGIAAMRFEGSPAAGRAELRWLVSAKVLGC